MDNWEKKWIFYKQNLKLKDRSFEKLIENYIITGLIT